MKEFIEQLKNYAELRLELLKISIAESSINAASSILVRVLLVVILITCLLTLELAVGLYLKKYYDDWSSGFFVIAGFNFFLFFGVVIFRKSLVRGLQNSFSKYV
jgi:hypothetical protein